METALNCSRHLEKYALNRDTKINPFTPKTDHSLNSPRKIKRPTNIESIRITENLNWRIIFCKKGNVTSTFRNEATKKHVLFSWENFFRTWEFMITLK